MGEEGQDGHLQQPKTVIIGAGIAGIAAGSYLANAGFTDFIILEATDRIGGRIQSVNLETQNDLKAELGANWIHGIDRNPIYKLAVHNNLLPANFQGRKLGQKHMFKTVNGKPVNAKVVEEVDWVYGLLMSQVEEFYQDQMPTPFENDSVGAFIFREFEQKMAHYQGEDLKLRMNILQQRMLNEAIITGCDSMHDVSLSQAGCFEELPGVHYVIPPGFEAICNIFTRNIPGEKILLNHPVNQVQWELAGGNGNGNNYTVCVECQNGKKFYANHVIVTCSLGYLKKCTARMFTPSLPEYKLNAIERLDIGTVDKIVLEFDSSVPILPDGVKRLELVQEGARSVDERHEKWYEKISFFEAIADNVLIGWLCGEEAEHMETLPESEVGKKCVELLKSSLKTANIPPIKKIICSKWKSMPYTLGSYSYIPVGASAEDVELLGKPVCDQHDKPRILFAGEATHPCFYSSSHGALLSGEREAERIINLSTHH